MSFRRLLCRGPHGWTLLVGYPARPGLSSLRELECRAGEPADGECAGNPFFLSPGPGGAKFPIDDWIALVYNRCRSRAALATISPGQVGRPTQSESHRTLNSTVKPGMRTVAAVFRVLVVSAGARGAVGRRMAARSYRARRSGSRSSE